MPVGGLELPDFGLGNATQLWYLRIQRSFGLLAKARVYASRRPPLGPLRRKYRKFKLNSI